MKNGFWMKTLVVDLTTGSFKTEVPDEAILRSLIGGAGMASRYLMRNTTVDTQPLDPENPVIFTTGPFQATKLPGSAKFSIVSLSPLTGGFMDTAAGATFGHALKKSGFDFIIVKGRSEKPVYLVIEDGTPSLVEAQDLWGKDSFEAAEVLSDRHSGASVAAIGPAGERMVGMACVYVDRFSAAGRGGLGAVMGSKNLKALAVSGGSMPEVHDPESLKALEKRYRKSVAENAAPLREGGTVGGLVPGSEAGNLPVKNWSVDGWAGHAEKIGMPGYTDLLKPKLHPCSFCPVACHRSSDVDLPAGGHYKGPAPEYETLALLGSSCMIDDLPLLVRANDYCNRMGLDTISSGSCAAFAMEALEKGHTNGRRPDYDLTWGSGEGLMRFLEELAGRKGFGGLFSDGIAAATARFAPEAADYACHVKGLDVPGHDPRVYYNLGLNYATGNRGACHMRAYSQISTMGALIPEAGIDTAPAPDTLEGAAHVVKTYQDFTAFYNSCVLCQFMIWGGFGLGDMVKCLNTITGWDMSVEDVMESGERVFTLQRMINNRSGLSGEDDRLPKRFFEASSEGGRAGKAPFGLDEELERYYRERGWDEDGFPGADKKKSLGVEALLAEVDV